MRRRFLAVPLGIILRPAPEVVARVFQRALGFPAELGIRARRVRGEVEDVAGAAGGDFVGDLN
jgi:hypothetical protein